LPTISTAEFNSRSNKARALGILSLPPQYSNGLEAVRIMFKFKKIKAFKIKGNELWIRYKDENWQYLTKNKVDLEDFWQKQRQYYLEAKRKN